MEAEDDQFGSMMDEIHSNGGVDDSSRHRPIISGEQLDIEAYDALYSGRTKIMRLLFIADRCNNASMQLEALRMAYDEIKKGENTQLFREVVQKINGRLGPNYGPDAAWTDSVDRRAEQRKEKLENELNAYRTNLIKESIRMGYNDFGDFYYAHGQLGEAFKNYVRTRDYCTTAKHIIHMCLNAILVSIEMGQFTHVTSYVSKAEQSQDALDPITTAKLRCAAGLAHLEAKKYKLAARKSKVIDNINFRNFLELVPEVRELIQDFYTSHYASCLEYLGNLKANLLLDIHLHDHVETLYNQIRNKALIQYTHPFVSVDLNMMANAFKTTVTGLEKELESLITDNQIQARIDSHNKILYARHADQRNATFQRVLQTGGEFDRDIWHDNVPYNKIANRKVHRGLMKKEGSYITFSDGGAMFPDGAKQYIEKLKQYIPMAGGVLRTVLDMGSGVGSFGGFLLAEDMLTLSFAPKDSSKQHIQFALERGVPAFAATLGNYRLPFSAFSFDLVHCYQCSIPFTAHNATYFVEVDRLLRPGAYLVISGPPVQWAKQDKEWADLQAAARSLCYELIAVDGNTAIWKKPNGDSCLPNQNEFGLELCDDSDEPSVAWYIKLKKCVSKTSSVKGNYAIGKIPIWPKRVTKASSRATALKYGLDVFEADNRRWARRVAYYKNTLNLKLGTPAIRNVMDMNAFLGGFAAALSSDPVWVMNVIPARKTLTLDVIYDRGLIGVYHNWCEPFSTYPRSYDLIHVSAIQSLTKDPSFGKSRCNLVDLMVEIDRMLRPQGTVVIRDSPHVIESVERIARVVRWTASIHEDEPGSHGTEKILVATKKIWTPSSISS
nr:probable methyltransferase PMT13 [Ipomoea batatas]